MELHHAEFRTSQCWKQEAHLEESKEHEPRNQSLLHLMLPICGLRLEVRRLTTWELGRCMPMLIISFND